VANVVPADSGCINGVAGKLNIKFGRTIPNFQYVIRQEVLYIENKKFCEEIIRLLSMRNSFI
jgi:hypothetical protein